MGKTEQMSLDLNRMTDVVLWRLGRSEIQRWGAEHSAALLPMVVKREGGVKRWVEDLCVRAGVAKWRRSDRYGGARL